MLKLTGITKTYGTNLALDDVTLTLQQGSCFGLIGPNGAGKSTLIKIIAGIIKQDVGTLDFEGTPYGKERIGYVPQEICLEESVSAIKNLCFFGSFYRLKGKQLQERAEEVLNYIGLSNRKRDLVKTFSGGMKRRLNIGCAMMHGPDILMMDEPTVGIDPQSRKQIMQLIEKMRNEGRTIIYSTHYLEEAEKLCDEVVLINKGKIIIQAPIHELLREHTLPGIFFSFDHTTDVTALKPFGKTQSYKTGHVLQTKNTMHALETLLQICRDQETMLQELEFIKPTLEDVFFKFADEEKREK